MIIVINNWLWRDWYVPLYKCTYVQFDWFIYYGTETAFSTFLDFYAETISFRGIDIFRLATKEYYNKKYINIILFYLFYFIFIFYHLL